jgi:hypothetical protein
MVTKKKVVKKVQKKVVKKLAVKKSPLRIENMDLVKYFKTGEKEFSEDLVYIEGNVLSCITNFPTPGDSTAAAIKVDGYIIINGDGDVIDNAGDFDDVVDQLQDYGSMEITTSFVCLKNAGIDLNKIKVMEITNDLDVTYGEKGFDKFESTVPQGATYKEYPDSNYNLTEGDDGYCESEATKILEKRYHRAGCMLIRAEKHSYICGMDEESYFVTKLSKNVTTIEKAFRGLKPKAVQQWEKKNGILAIRQGEWFFLPTELVKVKGMRRKGLPLWKSGGNKHMAERYAVEDGRNYVKGRVHHVDHEPTYLGDIIHEAIMNTQLGSWSEQGVD